MGRTCSAQPRATRRCRSPSTSPRTSCSARSSSTRCATALRDSGIAPGSLTLELTESVMMQDLEVSLAAPERAARARRETRDRRLRHRLLLAELHPPVPDGHPQDRPLVPARPQPRNGRAHRGDRLAGAHLQAEGRRRGRSRPAASSRACARSTATTARASASPSRCSARRSWRWPPAGRTPAAFRVPSRACV